jgi:hypothetical protein
VAGWVAGSPYNLPPRKPLIFLEIFEDLGKRWQVAGSKANMHLRVRVRARACKSSK